MAMLAVLKTGAAYLPIDPAHPDARIEFMVADAAPIAAVTTAELRARLARVRSGGHRRGRRRASTPNPSTALAAPAADDMAYLIYTSGTTGVPKGVAHDPPQRDPAAGVLAMSGLPDAGVWTQWHSYAFDVSVWEIWGALLGGGRLVVVPEQVAAHRRTSTPCWSPSRSACCSDPVGGGGALAAGSGVGGVGGRPVRRARPSWWIGGRRVG